MEKAKFTRFLCLCLAALCLIGTPVAAASADSAEVAPQNISVTEQSIETYKSTMNTISYDLYQETKFGGLGQSGGTDAEYVLSLLTGWTFCKVEGGKGIVILCGSDGSWKMQVGPAYGSIGALESAGYDEEDAVKAFVAGNNRWIVPETTYTTLADAVAAGYAMSDLAYVDTFDGVESIYTPSVGTVTWNLDVGAEGITRELYNIALRYYPVVAKSTSVERKFYINGEVPFSEARALTFPKIWSSFGSGSKASPGDDPSDPTVIANRLTAEFDAADSDFSADDVERDAIAAGFEKVVDAADVAKGAGRFYRSGNEFLFSQPDSTNAKVSELLDTYGIRFFITDKEGNEMRPTQIQDPEWATYVFRDSKGYSHDITLYETSVESLDPISGETVTTVSYGKTPTANAKALSYTSLYFGFVIEPDASGKVQLTLTGVNEPMALSDIIFTPYRSTESYAAYRERVEGVVGSHKGSDKVKLEAEYPIKSSTNVVYPVEDRSSALTSPVDPSRTVLNTIGTEKWENAGQWVEYRFSVDDSGFYDIYARFKQSYLDGMYVNRSLQIFTDYASKAAYRAAVGNDVGYYDGVPFLEASELRYNYGSGWQVTALSNNASDTYQVYFEKGVVYTIRIEVTLGSMSEQVRKIEDILNSLNNDYLTIIKLTGTSPDAYRDYNFARLLPDTLVDMIVQAKALDEISHFLSETAGVASTYTGVCDKLSNLLRKMAFDEDQIAKNLENFKSYVGSLGTFLTDAKTQPLQLDYLTVQSADDEDEIPKDSANFFQAFWHEFKCFIQSFFRDYNSMGATDENAGNEHRVSVWVPYGRDQANVIRNLSTNDFTQNEGIAVDLKLVNGGTLLPSILAGMGPDVYLGLAQATVINYAIRGALLNIENMEGFDEALTDYNDAALTVLRIADSDNEMHYYGLPETQSFQMMFVRLDILADLDIEIPRTWEDIYVAQSVLQSNNMEIGTHTDYQIFLYQMNGNLWADGGMRINLDSTLGLDAFETMCNMFTQYSFPYAYEASNRFRTGEMPIVIADYVGLYNKLKVFATELDGCWTFVPLPGYLDEETGEINNCSISGVSATVMISGTSNVEAAWKYMRWYTGENCQPDYANEMVAIIGDSAKHSTANIKALEKMPWTHDEYVEVQKQFNNLASVENYPGCYILGRYTEFAFLAALNKGANPTSELLSYINIVNKEITRKREEFGLETLEIGETLAAKRSRQISQAITVLGKRTTDYDADALDRAIKTAKYGIANDDAIRLQEAADSFLALLTSYRKVTLISQSMQDGMSGTDELFLVKVNEIYYSLTRAEFDAYRAERGDKFATAGAYFYISDGFVYSVMNDSSYATYLAKSDAKHAETLKDAQEDFDQTQSYYVNVSKQTAETKNGGYLIDSLSDSRLIYFIYSCLCDASDAIASY